MSSKTSTTLSRGLVLVLAMAFGGALAQGTNWPEKAITIVVPTPAGGANDGMARIIAQGLSARLGRPVLVDNRAGANGAIASEFVARAPADGYTLLFGYIATHGINPALKKLNYDPVTGFAPIGMVAASPTVLVVGTSVPASNAQDLVRMVKMNPGALNYATGGPGTVPSMAGEMFRMAIGAEVVGVPYKGSAPAVVDTIAGTAQFMFPSLFTAYPHIQSGKLKALGIAGDHRSKVLKDVPTLAEQGVLGVSASQWYAMFAPARTPQAVVTRLNAEMNAVLNDSATERKIEGQGAEVETSTPEQLQSLVKREVDHWRQVVRTARIKVE